MKINRKPLVALLCTWIAVAGCTTERFVAETKVMEPTIPEGSTVVADLSSRLPSEIERFDIVLFEPKDAQGKVLINRVLGIPGERIELGEDEILIDGAIVELPNGVSYSSRDLSGSDTPITDLRLGPDEFFLMGDNYAHAYDSRFRGPVSHGEIRGIVTRIKPPTNRRMQ